MLISNRPKGITRTSYLISYNKNKYCFFFTIFFLVKISINIIFMIYQRDYYIYIIKDLFYLYNDKE